MANPTTINLQELTIEIDDFIGQETFQLAKLVYKNAVSLSPVMSGAYAASWAISSGSDSYMYRYDLKPKGKPEHYQNSSFIGLGSKPNRLETLYVTNGAPYAHALEYGGPNNMPRAVAQRAIQASI